MPSPRPEDIRQGAIPRDPACHICGHSTHMAFPCDHCPCSHDVSPGIDT